MNFKNLKSRKIVPSCIALSLMLGVVGCSSASVEVEDDGVLNIVATTTMLHDLASVIGGDNIEAIGLMGPGIDPHLYEASAGDVTKMQEADVVLYNGIHLEGKMGEIFEDLDSQEKDIICIEDGIDEKSILKDAQTEGALDPHIWFDVDIWTDAAKYVCEELSSIDPDNASEYKANLENYLVELKDLDNYIKNRVEELDENQRVLVTAHDAFGYFGNAYDFEVKGLQGITTDAEAGTADVSQLASFIAENKIKAVFVESSVPPKNIEALQDAVKAKGFDVEIGGELYSDSLGDESTGDDSYIETFKANVDTIVDALK